MPKPPRSFVLRYLTTLAAVFLGVALRWSFDPILGDRLPFIMVYPAVMFAAWYGGLGPSVLALVLGWLASAYFFGLPERSFLSGDATDRVVRVLQILIGVSIIAFGELHRATQRRLESEVAERRRTEEATRAQGERFRITLSSIGDAVIVTNARGQVALLNPVAERMTGWRSAEAVGQPLEAVFHTVEESTRKTDEMPLAEVLGGECVEYLASETVLIARDGTALSVEQTSAPIRDERGNIRGAVLSFRDITERKDVERQLRENEARQAAIALENARLLRQAQESEQWFRQIAENITAVFWMVDVRTPRMLYVSPAYEVIWGRSCKSLYEQPRSFLDAIHPDDLCRVINALDLQFRGLPTAEEYRIVRPDGSLRWIWDRGFPVKDDDGGNRRVAGIAEDITERKRAEEASQRFKFISDHANDGHFLIDQEARFLYVNEVARERLGYTHEEILTLGVLDIDPMVDRAKFRELFESIRNERIAPFESVHRRKDGSTFPVEISITSVKFEGQTYAFAVARDITERKRAEEALRDSDRRKDEFLAMLAHELRNPLAPIRNALHLMKHANGAGSDLEAEREMVERQVLHMTRLVDDLLDVSRISRGKIELRKEPIELAAAVERTIGAIRPLIEEYHHELIVSLPPEPIRLEADPTRLEQVLWNLLNNAAKYTDPGGRIELIVEIEGEMVALRVRDNGIGITPEMLPQIFDLFVQVERRLDRSQGGLGIGLSLVRNLVEMHGGSVTALSAGLGRGSEFVIRLPRLDVAGRRGAPAAAPPTPADSPLPEQSHGFRILVVDDNEDSANSLAKLLRRVLGQNVEVAYDGASALERARIFHPDLVFLDIGLPGMDGYEVARRLRESPENRTPVLVALTGWGQEEDRRRSREAGFDRHLVKPIDPDMLGGLLTELAPAAK
jgi:PAS domain S-box-containing protein